MDVMTLMVIVRWWVVVAVQRARIVCAFRNSFAYLSTHTNHPLYPLCVSPSHSRSVRCRLHRTIQHLTTIIIMLERIVAYFTVFPFIFFFFEILIFVSGDGVAHCARIH